jgi:tRNA U34 2-thiouridine synthase MnmA/TrmU
VLLAFRRLRIRHRAEPVPGLVRPEATSWRIELDRPAWAPAPGQAAVFYDDDQGVIGGGRIADAAVATA